uniref:28S ribosomal protein S22 n=1 Tax=Trichobilharzia regenti TaxID=157069 RepID=A0AA85K7G5_TRIRE|nr:unnamed protein product [Trichobilharzia regenti]
MHKVRTLFTTTRLHCADLLKKNNNNDQVSRNLQDLFTNPQIHNLLRLITHTDTEAVHQQTHKKFGRENIKLLTDAELNIVKKYTSVYTEQKLQMPPVLQPRRIVDDQIISQDSGLQGLLPGNIKLVFTDTTLKRNRKNRLIVVRESNGTLRHANACERDRINQVYFPLSGRRLYIPLMFEDKQLNALLDQGSFLYILDRTCVQFEPDDPNFSRICHRVYDRVNQLAWTPFINTNQSSDDCQVNPLLLLRHTRYYGPLALYMIASLGSSGPLIYEALAHRHYDRLGWLLRLICLIRPSSPFAVQMKSRVDLIPPETVSALDYCSGSYKFSMTPSEINDLLECVELFIKVEPLGENKKSILYDCLRQVRESCAAVEEEICQES